MKNFAVFALATTAMTAGATIYNIEAGDDFEASCLMMVQPGDTCRLARGDYYHDGLTRTHGTADARITIEGESGACIKGSNTQDRVFQVAHDYYTIKDLCFDGDHDGENVATAIYVLGADRKGEVTVDGNTVKSSVTGLQLFDLEIKNFAEECVHFRYFVTYTEVQGCTVQHCGMDAFENGKGGKVGECFYLGTALDQVDDNKAPEVKLRTGSADNVNVDNCSHNWIHHNTLRSYGNECVDVKEGSTNNLIEHNVCEQQQDPNSGGFGLRGSDNTVRWNEISECKGAGVRMGGEDHYGRNNNIYGNDIKNTDAGAFSVQSPNQGVVCENRISGVDTVAFGSYSDQSQFLESNAIGECSSYPGVDGLDGGSAPSPSPADDDGDDDDDDDDDDKNEEDDDTPSVTGFADDGDEVEAGVNYTDDVVETLSEIYEINTNNAAGSTGQGGCATVLEVNKVEVDHAAYSDKSTSVEDLFDSDLDTYYSINRESTRITFELEEETEVNGAAIGFFMKSEAEERIMTFDISVKKAEDTDWRTVLSRKESSGAYGDIQTFPFSSRTALYVRFESHGNTFNNWTPLTELEICGKSQGESNALFGGIQAVSNELESLSGQICSGTEKINPVRVKGGGSDNVKTLFDGNFDTRWTTTNTEHESDLDNDAVQLTFEGDMRVSHVKIAFFDGDLANQAFSVYTQAASDWKWTPVILKEKAALDVGLQTFDLNMDGVHTLYIVGNGNSIGSYSKISEVEVWGC